MFQRRWRSRIKISLDHGLASAAIIAIGSGAALVVSQYNPNHSRARPKVWLKKWPTFIARLSNVQHPPHALVKKLWLIIRKSPRFSDLIASQWIQQPSPAIFTIAWAIFALVSLLLYHSHEGDRYQDHILVIVCTTCMVGGLALSERGLLEVLGTYLPCCIELGFLISMLMHQSVWRTQRSKGISDGEGDGPLLVTFADATQICRVTSKILVRQVRIEEIRSIGRDKHNSSRKNQYVFCFISKFTHLSKFRLSHPEGSRP